MVPTTIETEARRLIGDLVERNLRLATAESLTGGLIAAALTEVPGSSRVLERGFVTYTNAAKAEMLGVPMALIDTQGAVSREVVIAMARGALTHSHADVAVAVTGVAGPDGGTAAKPVGLVHIATAVQRGETLHRECRFGALSRSEIRQATVAAAFAMVRSALKLQA